MTREIIRTFYLDGIGSTFSIRSESSQSSKCHTDSDLPTAAELMFEMHKVGKQVEGEASAEDLSFCRHTR